MGEESPEFFPTNTKTATPRPNTPCSQMENVNLDDRYVHILRVIHTVHPDEIKIKTRHYVTIWRER